ncbi:MAG: FHA domain-containing protein [Anaerolineae bacterium]|nr:FHA domain-containing protein [Anaerolineae bacterium]
MSPRNDDLIRKVTTELGNELFREALEREADITYYPVPRPQIAPQQPVWRVRFDLAFDSQTRMGLDITDELDIGRGDNDSDVLALFPQHDIEKLGVSRHHVRLSPTATKLFIMDLNSTNGTALNGHPIGVNMPYSLADGDYLTLGRLEMVVRIIQRPKGQTSMLRLQTNMADILPQVGRSITSQLDSAEVLKSAMDAIFAHVQTDEVSIWLMDEQTGELFQEAGRGVDDEQIKRLPVTDTLAGQVMASGKSMRANRQKSGELIKVKTGYLVEALIYVPMILGGVTFGVIAAAQRETGKTFGETDEKFIAAVADFTAAAIQNARLYQATNHALARRSKVITALNAVLSYDLKTRLNAALGYAGLLNNYPMNEEMAEITAQVVSSGQNMTHLIDQLIEITGLSETPMLNHAACDLVEIVQRAISDLTHPAAQKDIRIALHMMGEPYFIVGDGHYLYRSILNLVDNGIKFSPRGAQVAVTLAFGCSDVIIRVRDSGPGIPEEHLPYLFDKYFRGKPAPDSEPSLGLGLELVRATIEAHRGTVIARNHEDGGAEFIVTLPVGSPSLM